MGWSSSHVKDTSNRLGMFGSYGLLHSPESAEHVREFLEAIEEVLDEQLLEGQ